MTRPRGLPGRTALAAAAVAIGLGALAGCGSSSTDTSGAARSGAAVSGDPATASGSTSPDAGGVAPTGPAASATAGGSGTSTGTATGTGTGTATRGPTGGPSGGPTGRPTGPAKPGDLTAIVTVARASTGQVAQLHDIAVSAGHPGAIPADLIPTTAKTLASTLRQQAGVATMLKVGSSTPQGRLAAALRSYGDLADTVTSWDAGSGTPLTGAFFTRLASTDSDWKAAMKDVGSLAHRDLLANTPALLLPQQ